MRKLSILLACAALGSLGFNPLLADWTVTVPQGQVGVWAGDGEASCGMDGEMWPAIKGNCYFPIDFERSPGAIEIARWDGDERSTGWLTIEEVEFELQKIDFPDDSFVNLSPENLERHETEQAAIQPVLGERGGDARFTLPLGNPLDPMVEGEFFGVRREYNGVPKNAHSGSDYAVGMGTTVQSIAPGTVTLVGEHFFAGKSVYVNHGDHMVSVYFHLSETTAAEGDEVEAGAKVAASGSTGRSTGPHLHVGVQWHGAWVDPDLLFSSPDGWPTVSESSDQ